jgi:hypothetical protein
MHQVRVFSEVCIGGVVSRVRAQGTTTARFGGEGRRSHRIQTLLRACGVVYCDEGKAVLSER